MNENLLECPLHGYTVKQIREAYYPDVDQMPGVFELACKIYNIEPHLFKNQNYGILVAPYAFGQYRIKLLDMRKMSHDNIVREMCTYRDIAMFLAISAMTAHDDPEQWCRSVSRPWNTENPIKGRIRLDNKPGALNTNPDGTTRNESIEGEEISDELLARIQAAWIDISGPYDPANEMLGMFPTGQY